MKQEESYIGRNPKNGDKINVRPKNGLLFKVGKDLRHAVNENRAVG